LVGIAPRQFRITGICDAVTHLRQEAATTHARSPDRCQSAQRFALFPV
jgi:hypothetical protein